jgi:hypothetical protein
LPTFPRNLDEPDPHCAKFLRGTLAVSQFAVAALSERRKPLGIQERRSETVATEFRLRNYRDTLSLDKRLDLW